MRTRQLVTFVALFAWASSSTLLSRATNPWYGTWELNLEKSTYAPGATKPRKTTTRVERWDDGLKYTSDSTTAGGATVHTEWRAKFDGKDYAVTGVPTVDSYTIVRVDGHTYDVIAKKDGRMTTRSRSVISADGKTRTVTQLGTHADGEKVDNTLVFDRK
jgi:hypothetical protein